MAHTVVFFIFLVSNIGGCLTPLGDPPLFLGYLRGGSLLLDLRLSRPGCSRAALLLAIYFFWDRRAYARETREDLARDRDEVEPIASAGRGTSLLLGGIVAAVGASCGPVARARDACHRGRASLA